MEVSGQYHTLVTLPAGHTSPLLIRDVAGLTCEAGPGALEKSKIFCSSMDSNPGTSSP
jgi:hypothetical protein